MQRILKFFIVILLLFTVSANADQITLTTGETVTPPVAVKMDWYVDQIDVASSLLVVKYRWRDSENQSIKDFRTNSLWNTWQCKNIPDLNPDCIGPADPYECCTGFELGTCQTADPCFTNVFGFQIRQQDVGTGIGVGLRTLIWNEMKEDILTPGNDGTFD